MNKETDLMLESLKANGTHEMDLPYIEVKGDSVTIDGSLNVDDLRIIVSELEKQKPRTKTKFVKVVFEWNAWEYLKAFSELTDSEQWFIKVSDDQYAPIHDWFNVAETIRKHNLIYRKVETEIDERQGFIDTAMGIYNSSNPRIVEHAFGEMFDSGMRKMEL